MTCSQYRWQPPGPPSPGLCSCSAVLPAELSPGRTLQNRWGVKVQADFVGQEKSKMDGTSQLHQLFCQPRCFMYEIFAYIYPKHGPNVGKYSIHGASGQGWPNSPKWCFCYARTTVFFWATISPWVVHPWMPRHVRHSESSLPLVLFHKPTNPLVGGWATPLKNISQLGWWNSQYMGKKNVPNHQPVLIVP